MPIHPIGVKNKKGSLGCPYANRDYRTVNPCYGTMEDFRKLVDAIHALGMKCMIDVVYNHTSPDATLVTEHPEFYYRKPDGSFGNKTGDWSDVIDLDYSNPALWDYQIESLRQWASLVDGFRCDVASFVPVDFWCRARAAVEEVHPGCIWLGETVHTSFSVFNRICGYYTVKAMTPAERLDLLKNGEKHLGRLYRKGAMATVRREWRGLKDTAYDYKEWLRMWGMLLGTFSKDLIPALNTTFWYRWMISYMCCVGFMDKNTMGLRGSNLQMSHLMIYDIFRYVAENLVLLAKGDRKNGNSEELNKKIVLFDEMTMGQIMAGFPDLIGIPYQLMPVFLVSEIDQLTCVPYIDAVESFGLPADTCPVPSSECGALVIDALPHLIPVCSIEKEYINAASGQLRTRFQAFVESVELKKLKGDRNNA